MAVLVEAISVIVRRDAIDRRFSGGWREFLNAVPNNTFCADEDLARVGFMTPQDVEAFVRRLDCGGLTFVRKGSLCWQGTKPDPQARCRARTSDSCQRSADTLHKRQAGAEDDQ